MLRIIDRYILREVFRTWLVVMLALLGVLLTNQFARILGDVAKDKLPRDAISELIFLTGLQYLTILIPVGLFLSILIALGRLYSNSEMSAMMACRVSAFGIYRPILLLTIPLVILSAWVTIDIGPKSLLEIERINNEARRKIDLKSIEPGRFIVDDGLGTVIYAEEVFATGELKNVFLQFTTADGEIEVVVAERGIQREVANDNERYFVLYDGKRYIGSPGKNDYIVMEFLEHGIPYTLPEVSVKDIDVKSMLFRNLLDSNDRQKNAEFHWRIGIPISTVILVFLAIPMSKSAPRQGQYNKIFSGIFTFIIYFNLLSAGKSWLENNIVDKQIGLWWVHLLMLMVLLILFFKDKGYHRRLIKGY